MKNSVFILISFLVLFGCGEPDEEICPICREIFPGVYDGIDEKNGNTTAIVKYLDKDTYTIQFHNSTWEIDLLENVDDRFVFFDFVNTPVSGSKCEGDHNRFVVNENDVDSHIILRFCFTEKRILGEYNIKFDGKKYLL